MMEQLISRNGGILNFLHIDGPERGAVLSPHTLVEVGKRFLGKVKIIKLKGGFPFIQQILGREPVPTTALENVDIQVLSSTGVLEHHGPRYHLSLLRPHYCP